MKGNHKGAKVNTNPAHHNNDLYYATYLGKGAIESHTALLVKLFSSAENSGGSSLPREQ